MMMENKKLEVALEKWQSIQPISDVDRERLSQRFTQKLIQSLQEKGYIEKDADGSWRVFITPSI